MNVLADQAVRRLSERAGAQTAGRLAHATHDLAPVLPPVGLIFRMQGRLFKVTYVNEGRQRFSCEPCAEPREESA